jgi:hypothetical protein
MSKAMQLDAWRRQEQNLFEARKNGFTTVLRRRKDKNRSREIPIEEAQKKNNAWFAALRRGGSYGCTVNRLV